MAKLDSIIMTMNRIDFDLQIRQNGQMSSYKKIIYGCSVDLNQYKVYSIILTHFRGCVTKLSTNINNSTFMKHYSATIWEACLKLTYFVKAW